MSSIADYSNFIALAKKLIAKYGRNFTLTSYANSGTVYDPVRTPINQTVKGVFTSAAIAKINPNLIELGDKIILIDSDYPVEISMKIQDDSEVYETINVIEVKPGNNLIMSKVIVRG